MTSPSYPAGIGGIAAIGGHPLYPMLVPLPIGALVMALGADTALMVTGEPFWGEAAEWLLLAVLVFGILASIVGFIDLIGINRARTLSIGLGDGIGNILVLFITGTNYLWRVGGEAVTASSYGIILTAAAVAVLMLTGWLGGNLVFRHGIGVTGRVGIDQTGNPDFLPGGRPDLGQR
jgi:uncharacterized membrane protein